MKAIVIPGYKIVNTLGVGGQATVYLAIQEGFEREVALKVMSPALAADPSFGERFIREAKIVAKLRHPGIVTVYDVGEHDGFYYLAMEYLPGVDLRRRISAGVKAKDALNIIIQIGKALDYAHQQGYIHRDVKSENILFQEDGLPVLTDFGIAKASNSSTQMTQTGKLIGTPQYMSPEQCRGRTLDGRSDIYSLGIIFYEMLTQHVPFEGEDSVAVCMQHVTKPIPKLPVRQQHFQWLLDRMMAKKPEDRFTTSIELAEKVEQFLKSGTHPELKKTESLAASREEDTQIFYEESGIAAGERFAPAREQTASRWPLFVLLGLVILGGVGYVQKEVILPMVGLESLIGKPNTSADSGNSTRREVTKEALVASSGATDNEPSAKQQIDDSAAKRSTSNAQQQAVEQQIAQLLIDAQTLQPLPDLEPAQLRKLLQNYLRVLLLDPKNSEAMSGVEESYQRVARDAKAALDAGNEATFLHLKGLIESNEPNHSTLTELATIHNSFINSKQQKAQADSRRGEINQWLESAAQAIKDNRLSKPKSSSAWYFYGKVLSVEPTNSTALSGLKQVKDKYSKTARQALLNKNIKSANASINLLAELENDSERVIELRQQYAVINQQVIADRKSRAVKEKARKQELARQEKLADPLTQLAIQSKLNSARTAFTENRLVTPDSDNALGKYREVLAIDSAHQQALEGVRLVESKLVTLATEAIQNNDESAANQWLEKLVQYFNKNDQVPLIKQQIAEMQLELPQES